MWLVSEHNSKAVVVRLSVQVDLCMCRAAVLEPKSGVCSQM